MELLTQYGLFLTKTVTVVVTITMIVAIIVNLAQRRKQRGELQVTNLSKHHKEMKGSLVVALFDGPQQKQWHKTQKKKQKQEAKAAEARTRLGSMKPEGKSRTWVLDFEGSMDAHEVNSLREEITAVLAVAKVCDQMAIRLGSPDGVVCGHGLAASQLQRLRDKWTPLTVAVDRVVASGGYMMACVANKVVSAPFTILDSIGVMTQIPSLHRFPKSKDIGIELYTVGQYKWTLIMLNENTEKGRRKFRGDFDETHHLFKDFVHRMRLELDIEQIATGEHQYGVQALEKGLVDTVEIGDGLLLRLMENHEVIGVYYQQHKKMLDCFTGSTAENADRPLLRRWQHGQKLLT